MPQSISVHPNFRGGLTRFLPPEDPPATAAGRRTVFPPDMECEDADYRGIPAASLDTVVLYSPVRRYPREE